MIYDRRRKLYVHGKNEFVRRECGYLTKMMTALTVIHLCDKFDLSIKVEMIKVDWLAASWGGNTIGLRTGDEISVENVLYGLMLRSGNDAALCLA